VLALALARSVLASASFLSMYVADTDSDLDFVADPFGSAKRPRDEGEDEAGCTSTFKKACIDTSRADVAAARAPELLADIDATLAYAIATNDEATHARCTGRHELALALSKSVPVPASAPFLSSYVANPESVADPFAKKRPRDEGEGEAGCTSTCKKACIVTSRADVAAVPAPDLLAENKAIKCELDELREELTAAENALAKAYKKVAKADKKKEKAREAKRAEVAAREEAIKRAVADTKRAEAATIDAQFATKRAEWRADIATDHAALAEEAVVIKNKQIQELTARAERAELQRDAALNEA
jgi:hypothetical protein